MYNEIICNYSKILQETTKRAKLNKNMSEQGFENSWIVNRVCGIL